MSTVIRSEINVSTQSHFIAHTDESLAGARVPRLLAVSFSYPPQTEPRAIQVSRLLKHLPASTVLVCAGDPSAPNEALSSECNSAESFLEEILRVPFPDSAWRDLVNRVSSRFPLPVWSRTPDPLVSWKKPVMDAVEQF